MTWIQLKFTVNKESIAPLEEQLLALGAQSITLTDAQDDAQFQTEVGEIVLWHSSILWALFDTEQSPSKLITTLTRDAHPALPPFDIEALEDKDWEREWMQYFTPMRMGERLWVCPNWMPVEEPNAVNLLLDPGLAFGTGTHPTTAMCLEWLDGNADAFTQNNLTILDYGCGSGILAVAALLLGAHQAVAIDHDPQAIIATRDNAQKNNINMNTLRIGLPHDMPKPFQADIVLANILAEPLISLQGELASHCKENGVLILSGILEEQANSVCKHYENHFRLIKTIRKDGWVRLDFKKTSKPS
ncbi:MAG: 50S ribosomal protein L11 methyltransferase [Pseudomonadota bacterium]